MKRTLIFMSGIALGAAVLGNCGPGTSLVLPVGTISPLNFTDNAYLKTRTLIGKAVLDVSGGMKVRYRFDDGADWKDASGTETWSIPLPNMKADGTAFRTMSRHRVYIEVVNSAESVVGDATYLIRPGVTRDLNGDGYSDFAGGALYTGTNAGAALVVFGAQDTVPDSEQAVPSALNVYLTPQNPSGGPDNSQFGERVAIAGDLNGDGYADLAVGALSGIEAKLAVYIYYGSADGISTTPSLRMTPPGSAGLGSNFASGLSGAGDVNGDGYDDLIIGAYSTAPSGLAFIYYGSADGVSNTPSQTLTYPEGDAGANFGRAVGYAGDVNRDGYADVIVGALASDAGGVAEGAAYIYHGSASGVSTAYATRFLPLDPGTTSNCGKTVSLAGDLNGDGYSDVMISCGTTYVFYGTDTGISTATVTTLNYPEADATPGFGESLGDLGDVDGDGYDDIAVGAYLSDIGGTNKGAVYVYHGSSTGLSATAKTRIEYPFSDISTDFAYSLSGPGDLNGDTFPDLLVGCPSSDEGAADNGALLTFMGSADGVSGTLFSKHFHPYPVGFPELGFSVH